MKKRITSFVLAVLMVLSMALVFSVSAFAETPNYTIYIGNAYGVAGGTAQVDIFVSAKEEVADQTKLREWQVTLTSTLDQKLDDKGKAKITPYTSDGDPKAFSNSGSGAVGCTTNVGENCGTIAQLLGYGGWKLGTAYFSVPSDAAVGTEYPVSISEVTVFGMENNAGAKTALAGQVATAAGKVVVYEAIDVDALKAAIAGGTTAKDVAIPTFFNGAVVSNITNGLTGRNFKSYLDKFYGTLTIPASVVDAKAAIEKMTAASCSAVSFILKDPGAGDVLTAIGNAAIRSNVGEAKTGLDFGNYTKVYYHKSPTDITLEEVYTKYDPIKGLPSDVSPIEAAYVTLDPNKEGALVDGTDYYPGYDSVELVNLLKVFDGELAAGQVGYKAVKGTDGKYTITFLAGITADDLDYSALNLSVKFAYGAKTKTFSKDLSAVYTTITDVASADQASAVTAGAYAEGFTYLAALTIRGVPAPDTAGDAYTVTVQLNGLTANADGADIGVCSDPVVLTVALA